MTKVSFNAQALLGDVAVSSNDYVSSKSYGTDYLFIYPVTIGVGE